MTETDLLDLLAQDVLEAARALVGAELVRGSLRARIVETEAYRGEDDPACHAFRCQTPRNKVLFGPPGFSYVYFNYGVHWMLNVTAHEPGRAAGILIRAAEPQEGLELMRVRRGALLDRQLLSGPGKLAQAFAVTNEDNERPLFGPNVARGDLRIIPAGIPATIIADTRIGIAKGKGENLPWRFLDAHRQEWLSQPRNLRT